MNAREVADIAMRAGELLLTSGAEIYRVEETMTRICVSCGIKCETFVVSTGIFLSVEDEAQSVLSLTKRVQYRTVDLHRIELLNSFSRNIAAKPPTYGEALELLEDIQKSSAYGFPFRLLASGAAGFIFTMLFKGSLYDGIASLLAGMLMCALKELISRFGFFQFFEYFISGLAAGFVSLGAVALNPELDAYRIVIGAIVIFLPGISITNGIKDALRGDLLSSLGRLGEATFVLAAVGAGVGLALSIGLGWV